MRVSKKQSVALAVIVSGLMGSGAWAADDGSQLNNKFRVNFGGYLPQASKLGLYLSSYQGPINWSLQGSSCSGVSDDFVANDHSSGDSFYKIDFSSCTTSASNLRLKVGTQLSAAFDISSDPLGAIKYEFFDYFKDHEANATFRNAKNNWQTGLNISFSYVKDAGDNGAYPVNTAEAAWALINTLETYPQINAYYSSGKSGARTVYQQLQILTEQFDHVFDHSGSLAIPKFHTNVNSSWAACSPHTSGTCIAEPETKATYSAARTLAAMARLHLDYGSAASANSAYQSAKQALNAAQGQAVVCNQADAFGGEGGMYPDNDNYSIWRSPKSFRDNCHPDQDNTADDQFAALVENYLAALKLGQSSDAAALASQVTGHPRFAEASSYWWGAVSMEGNLSLLANESLHSLNLNGLKTSIIAKATSIRANQALGYPGVTWDPQSNRWDSGDQDSADNNVRWGSHRMALNDARILMAAAHIQAAAGQDAQAADFARGALQVLDHVSGINALNLSMFTANGYTRFEHAVERTHDGADPGNQWPGKLVLGPNNWTNADDPAMPAFDSQPGLKMFALTGTGWSSREISIDANASLIPVAYFSTEVAAGILALDPISEPEAPAQAPAAPSAFNASAQGQSSVNLSWQDNAGSNDDAELGFYLYQATSNSRPSTASQTLDANSQSASVTGLQAGTQYYFWLQAFNNEGSSAFVQTSATTDEAGAYTNLVENGDFSSGTSAWSCTAPGGTASCSVVAGEYRVNISSGGSQAWHIQPLQADISLQSGRTYTFAFDARASANRSTQIKVERSVSPWEDFSQTASGQSLTTVMQRFVYTFNQGATLNNARVVLNIGASNADVVLDNVWLVEGANDPCAGAVGCSSEPVESYQISVSAGANGSISPGTTTVQEGDDQSFSIVADAGYHVLDVLKNGVSLGAVTSVSFSNVQADQSLSASFEQDLAQSYTISVNAGANGTISPGTSTVSAGSDQVFSISANSGYHVVNVVKNGVDLGPVSSVSFANVQANQSLSATFAQDQAQTFNVTVSSGANGSVSPASQVVNAGDDVSFSFTADAGYEVDDVVFNGSSLGALTSYTLTNVQANMSLSVSFKAQSTGGGSGPCASYCSNPVDVTSGQTGSVGTGAVCHEIKRSIQGGNCYNISSPRQLSVNGVPMSCSGWNLPAPENGGYCVQITAGGVPWAGYSFW